MRISETLKSLGETEKRATPLYINTPPPLPFHKLGGVKKVKKSVDILPYSAILFSVMRDRMKDRHIDWLNAQDDRVIAPVEGHEGYRVVTAMRASDLAEAVEDFGWFGDEALCGE